MPVKQGTAGVASVYSGTYKISAIYRGADIVYQGVKLDPNIPAMLNGTITSIDGLLGDEITTIPSYMFDGCYLLESITIPKNVTSIGSYALSSCTKLKKIKVLATTPPTFGSYMLQYSNAVERIECPASAYADYSSASGWSSYASNGILVGV